MFNLARMHLTWQQDSLYSRYCTRVCYAYAVVNDLSCAFAETPAQLMLGIISGALEGKPLDIPTLVAVRDALHRSADVYRPTAEAVNMQMDEAADLDVSAVVYMCGHYCGYPCMLNITRTGAWLHVSVSGKGMPFTCLLRMIKKLVRVDVTLWS